MSGNNTPFGDPNAADGEVFEIDDELDEALQEDPNEKWRMDEGDYRARVVDITQGTSKAGNAMWTWTWAIVSGKYAGRELTLWTALTAKAMFKLREAVEAIGVWKPGQKLRLKPSDIIGKEASLKVIMEEYNGRESAKIESVSALDDGAPSVGHNPQTGNDDDIPF